MRKGWPAVTPSAGSSPASARSSPRGRQTKMIAHYWLRSGHTGCVNGAAEFLRATRAQRPTHIRLGLWRADAGFGDESFLPACEEVSLPSIVVARLTQKVQSLCRHGVEGVQVQAVETGRVGRGLILVRQRIATRPEAGGKWLVEVPGDRFQALWTHLPPSVDALNVWRRYHGRADSENRLRELGAQFGIKGLTARSFWATEALHPLAIAAYNLCVLLQRKLGQLEKCELNTLRWRLFGRAAVWSRATGQADLETGRAWRGGARLVAGNTGQTHSSAQLQFSWLAPGLNTKTAHENQSQLNRSGSALVPT